MSVLYPSLDDHLAAIGNAIILVGDPSVAGGLEVLGLKEGDITIEWNEEYSRLTAPEQTGPQVHESKLLGENPVVNIPIIIGNPDLHALLSPGGTAAGGRDGPTPVVTTSLVIVPEAEFGSEFEYDGTAWTTGLTPATTPPKHAVWFWRGHFERPNQTFRVAEGGKRVETVRFQVMRAKAADPDLTLAVGQKLYLIGDPVAAGVSDLLI
jgi:hypothetical protein